MRNVVLGGHLPPKLGPGQAQCGEHSLARTPFRRQKNIGSSKYTFSVSHWVARYPGCKWSPGWSQLIMLTWSWAKSIQTDLKLKPCYVHVGSNQRQRPTYVDLSRGQVGAKWVQVGPKLGSHRAKLTMSDRKGALGRFCADMWNVSNRANLPFRTTVDFWRVAQANMPPPIAEAVPRQIGLSLCMPCEEPSWLIWMKERSAS